MLDKASEIYNSGLLNKNAQREFGAIVVTRDGIEVSASTNNGFRFEYANTWEKMRAAWAEMDAGLKVRRQEIAEERAEQAAFAQKVPQQCDSDLGRN